MKGIRAIGRAIHTIWDDLFVVLLIIVIGSFLSLFILPIPFVLGAHYSVAARLVEERVITWRLWFRCGRKHAKFFYKWALLVGLVSLVLLGNIFFYGRLEARWASIVQWATAGLLIVWLLFQPYVPACYLAQTDRRLRIALRNAAILALSDPFSTLVFWIVALPPITLLVSFAWPVLLLLPIFLVLVSIHTVRQWLSQRFGPSG